MSDLFDEDDLVESVVFAGSEEEVDVELIGNSTLDARRRLEKVLEEQRLLKELKDDFDD